MSLLVLHSRDWNIQFMLRGRFKMEKKNTENLLLKIHVSPGVKIALKRDGLIELFLNKITEEKWDHFNMFFKRSFQISN